SRSMQQNLPKRHVYTLVKTGSYKTETQKLSAAAAATVIVVALLVPAVLSRLVLLLLCLLVLAILALLLLTVLALILLGHGVLRFSAHRTALMVLRVRQKNRQPAAEICRVE
ncbi:MAG: hypothetical protein SOY50_09075, partial [Ruminococcus callidus]|nr:hypothetical protein [Ruminococcus callidus]